MLRRLTVALPQTHLPIISRMRLLVDCELTIHCYPTRPTCFTCSTRLRTTPPLPFPQVNPAVLRLFKLLLVLLVFWHWSACLYWFVCWIEEFQVHQPYFSRDGSNRWVPPPELWCTDAASCPTQSSIDRFVECERVNATTIAAGGTSKVGLSQCPGIVGDQYTYAFFWAVMVTTGIGRDVEPVTSLEHIFSIIWIVLGVVMNAIIIGAASSALQNLDAGGAERREKLENITRYMRQRNVPKDLQKRIREYYEYMWSSHQSLNADGGVMNDLHHSLTLELNIILNRKLIENIPMFRVITNTNCLIDLIEKLIPKIYIPGEYIVLEGEAGDEMYIMLRGLVHVLVGKHSNNKQHVATLKEGEVFGERALITRETRNASIRAATYCDLLVLSKDDFDEVMRRYPEFFHSLQHLARLHANKGWGRVREAIKMTRAIRHFGGQVRFRVVVRCCPWGDGGAIDPCLRLVCVHSIKLLGVCIIHMLVSCCQRLSFSRRQLLNRTS